jgi:hypothetical protein
MKLPCRLVAGISSKTAALDAVTGYVRPTHPPLAVCCCALQNFAGVSRYVEALLEARKGKNLTRDAALDAVTGDVNMFGVMMVAMGDAGGMVSGSIHTTAATIRPAMQVLKTPNLVSSVFFMCLPDKVRMRRPLTALGCATVLLAEDWGMGQHKGTHRQPHVGAGRGRILHGCAGGEGAGNMPLCLQMRRTCQHHS